jgi:hypothetical protein
MSLLNIPISDTTDKNTIHSYLETYESLFHSKQNTSGNILEIGVHFGGSIQLWNNYFKNAKIYGLDIADNISVNEIKDNENIILNVNVDAYNKIFVNNSIKNSELNENNSKIPELVLFNNNEELFIPGLNLDIHFKVGDLVVVSDWINPQEMLNVKIIKGFLKTIIKYIST